MQLEIVKTSQHFKALKNEWNDLLANSASHVPFLRHEYLSSWWETLGGGEWNHGDLNIVTWRSPQGVLLGIAPFFFTNNREGEAALMLLGSIEISDYLDIICRPEDISPFLSDLLPRLAKPDMPAWQVLDFYNILESSPTLPALQAGGCSGGVGVLPGETVTLPEYPSTRRLGDLSRRD